MQVTVALCGRGQLAAILNHLGQLHLEVLHIRAPPLSHRYIARKLAHCYDALGVYRSS